MRRLFLCEFERIWARKSIWLLFLSLPFVLIASAKYYLGHNESVSTLSPEYTSFANFPAAAMQEQLMSFFNIAIVLIFALIITEEYRSGQIRMVMIRVESFKKLFFSKLAAAFVTIFFIMILYYVLSIFIGYIMMPNLSKVHVFYYKNELEAWKVFAYSGAYYFAALLTLIAFASVIIFITLISKSVTTAVGGSIGFLLFSLIYPTLVYMLGNINGIDKMAIAKIQFLSLTHIQHMGIAIMLGERPQLVGLNVSILIIYTLIFTSMSYFIFIKRDKEI